MAAAKKTTKKAAKKKPTKAQAKKAAEKTAKKASAKKTTAAKTTAASANVVVASKVREAARSQEVRMSSEFVDALNTEVNETIAKAVARAKSNNRATVRPQDL